MHCSKRARSRGYSITHWRGRAASAPRRGRASNIEISDVRFTGSEEWGWAESVVGAVQPQQVLRARGR